MGGSSPRLLKLVALAVLVLQNVSLVLTMKASMGSGGGGGGGGGGPAYLVTVVVLLTETLKLLICVVVLLTKGKTFDWSSLAKAEGLKMAVPALLYVVQNNLLFFAVSRLEPAVYQVTYQLKIATTAVFSVLMLKRRLTRTQIFGICALLPGVCMVQLSRIGGGGHGGGNGGAGGAIGFNATLTPLPPGMKVLGHAGGRDGGGPAAAAAGMSVSVMQQMLGLAAVICSTITSGFAGVYFEKVLKSARGLSLWERNVQLAAYSIVCGVLTVVVKDGGKVVARGSLFSGISFAVVGVIVLQAAGGLLIAVVVKYADNIAKAFATSVSVIISCVLSILFFGFNPPVLFFIGAALVGYAVYVYSSGPDEPTTRFFFKAVGCPAEAAGSVLPR